MPTSTRALRLICDLAAELARQLPELPPPWAPPTPRDVPPGWMELRPLIAARRALRVEQVELARAWPCDKSRVCHLEGGNVPRVTPRVISDYRTALARCVGGGARRDSQPKPAPAGGAERRRGRGASVSSLRPRS